MSDMFPRAGFLRQGYRREQVDGYFTTAREIYDAGELDEMVGEDRLGVVQDAPVERTPQMPVGGVQDPHGATVSCGCDTKLDVHCPEHFQSPSSRTSNVRR